MTFLVVEVPRPNDKRSVGRGLFSSAQISHHHTFFMSYFVYIIRSDRKESLYKGQTESLDKRLAQHNAGKVKSTKSGVPWRIVYTEAFKTREEALAREKYFKTAAGRRFIKKLNI